MKTFLWPKTRPRRSQLADLELMMWSKGNPCAYERDKLSCLNAFAYFVVGFRGLWVGHLSKVGFNAEVIIQEEGTPKSSEMMWKTPGLESLWMARRESGSLSLSTRARRHRRRRRIGEIRLGNGARYGP